MIAQYKVQVDVCLRKPVEENNIWMRHVRYLPFVPRAGDTLRLTAETEDEAETLDVAFDSVVYDAAEGVFVAEYTDDTIVEHYSATGLCNHKDLIAVYARFDFVRVTFPTVQV